MPSVHEIVDLARTSGLPAIALTDTNALYGAMEFISDCRQAGIAPILGAELTLTGGHSIVLLAQNMRGYGNLCRLITRLQAAPDREAALARALPWPTSAQHTEGLIALSGGCSGPLDASLRDGTLGEPNTSRKSWSDLFGRDRFFVELQIIEEGDSEKASALQSLADRLGLDRRHARHPLPVARRRTTLPCLDRHAKGAPPGTTCPTCPTCLSHRRMRCGAGSPTFPPRSTIPNGSPDQCHLEFPLGQLHFPTLGFAAGAHDRARNCGTHALAGAAQRYGDLTPAIEARLRKEVDVIDTLGYTPYFLVVADIVRYAREQARAHLAARVGLVIRRGLLPGHPRR